MAPPFNTLFEQLDSTFSGYDVSSVFQRAPINACKTVNNYAFANIQSPCEPDSCISLSYLVEQQGLQVYNALHGKDNSTVYYSPRPTFQWDDVVNRNLVVVGSNGIRIVNYR